MTKLYIIAGASMLLGYLVMESRGTIFASTDTKPRIYNYSSGSGYRSSGYRSGYRSGGVYWGSGYRSGK